MASMSVPIRTDGRTFVRYTTISLSPVGATELLERAHPYWSPREVAGLFAEFRLEARHGVEEALYDPAGGEVDLLLGDAEDLGDLAGGEAATDMELEGDEGVFFAPRPDLLRSLFKQEVPPLLLEDRLVLGRLRGFYGRQILLTVRGGACG